MDKTANEYDTFLDDDHGPFYKVVHEPGIQYQGNDKLIGSRRMLQPCDKDQNPIAGERSLTSFIVERIQPWDRSRYMPHQGVQEMARRRGLS